MRSFRVLNKGLKAVTKPMPKLRAGWALIRVRMAGICNTDVEILRGYHAFRGTLGHEFVGEVAEVAGVSEKVRLRWLGKRVAGEINVSCSAYGYKPVCEFLPAGSEDALRTADSAGNCGARWRVCGISRPCRWKICMWCRRTSATRRLFSSSRWPRRARFSINSIFANFGEAAVLGDGKLAQLIALVLQAAGARVTMYGKHAAKLALAWRAGVTTKKVRGDAGDLKRVKESFRLVVEATGSPTGLTLAQQMTEPRGTLLLKSTFHGAAPVETWPIVVKEITVVGSRCGPFAKAIALLRTAKVDPTPLISRTFALAEAAEAIDYAQRRDVMKVLLRAE